MRGSHYRGHQDTPAWGPRLIKLKSMQPMPKVSPDSESGSGQWPGQHQETSAPITDIEPIVLCLEGAPRSKYGPNISAPKCTQQKSAVLKGKIDNNTMIVRDFNIPLSTIDKSSRQKINKETQ